MEIKEKNKTGPNSSDAYSKKVILSELKNSCLERRKSQPTIHQKKLSSRFEEIEHKIKKIEMQLYTTVIPDSTTETNDSPENVIVERINAYRETVYQALRAAIACISDNSREIERVNRIIAKFLKTRNGGYEINRMLSNISDIQNEAIISRREKEILTQLIYGKTNKEISRELDISEKTVKNHLWKIYKKLDVKSRTQLFHRLICPRPHKTYNAL